MCTMSANYVKWKCEDLRQNQRIVLFNGGQTTLKIYNINKGIGYASSGVEYAQKYRKDLLAKTNADDYYIFLDYISANISVFTDLMGFKHDQVINIYNYLSGRPTVETTYTVEDFLATLGNTYDITSRDDKGVNVKIKDLELTYRIWLLKNGLVDRIDRLEIGKLTQAFEYDTSLSDMQEFRNGKIVRRVFYRLDGTVALEQYYHDNDITTTMINGHIIYGTLDFYMYFFNQLNIQPDDVVIIDRALEMSEAFLPRYAGKTRIMSVVHAEHFNEPVTEGDHIAWNNFYEYVFDHAKYFETIIVSTERQRQILASQLPADNTTDIVTIPVGYVEQVISDPNYDPYALVTASRLAPEKHLDVIVKAVAKAKNQMNKLTLDIYGEGGERQKLEKLIKELNASDYIHLEGHRQMAGVYAKYGAYVSASTSEGFGLSLLEATSESLPIIGVDVEYGNREFVQPGKNGILYPKSSIDELDEQLYQALIAFYDQGIENTGRKVAQNVAKEFLGSVVAAKWEKLLGLK